MRLYIAAKTHDYPRAREIMKVARGLGHEVTQDWTVAVERHGVEQEQEPPTDEQRQEYAMNDLRGVANAQQYVGLWHPNLKGTWIEFGIAVGLAIPIWMVGVPDEWHHLVFLHLPLVTLVEDDDHCIEMLHTLPVPVGEKP